MPGDEERLVANRLRLAPAAAALALYAVFVALWLAAPDLFPVVIRILACGPTPHPYADLDAVLRAAACWHEGVNVYAPSPCMHGGVYNYAPLLLRAGALPIGPHDACAGGLALGVAFCLSLLWLPPPESRAALAWRLTACCSGAVIYALDRANIDLLMFLLCLLGLRLLARAGRAAPLGYALFLLGGALKFYPAALLVLLAREKRAIFLTLAGVIAACAALYLMLFGGAVARAIAILPSGLPFWDVFGAINLPFGLVLLHFLPELTLDPTRAQFLAVASHPLVAVLIGGSTRLLIVLALAAALWLSRFQADFYASLSAEKKLFLVAGAAIICFCFFAAQNIVYREIFLLWVVAGLGASAPRAMAVIVFLLWSEFFRHLLTITSGEMPRLAFWLLRELCWWGLAIWLTGFMFCFLRARFTPGRAKRRSA